MTLTTPNAANSHFTLESLERGDRFSGFRTEAVYLDASGLPFGARFLHERTGFTLDYLRMQSVPQAFLWVTTYPTSDKGEPHTQEHLLLGKGSKGRAVASLEDMALVRSSAYTEQTRTCYHFHTGAGSEVFFRVFEARMEAVLRPDYTDEEVRREVRNFGVTVSPADGSLRLEEKGTVYNEMVRSFERPGSRLWRAVNASLYGPRHPLALSSGGYPAAIREMTPGDIRRFHREHYFLANMGLIAALPREIALAGALERFGEILDRLEPEDFTPPAPVVSEDDLPPLEPAPEGATRIVEYPNQNARAPGSVLFVWPATLDLGVRQRLVLELFLNNIAGDSTTNLYKLFVDRTTRRVSVGARGVYAGFGDDLGHPIYVGLVDVAAEQIADERIAAIRDAVRDELGRVAAWPDGSPELVEFNRRMRSRIVSVRRALSKFVDSPPGFGFRGASSTWIDHLELLERGGGFERSVTLEEELRWIEEMLGRDENVWRDHLSDWKLLATTPYAVATRANPRLIEREEDEREARIDAELERLKSVYGSSDEQETIRRFKHDYEQVTAELERLERRAHSHRFVDEPPMTLDDRLDYRVAEIAGVPAVVSTFDTMSSATVGAAFRIDGVAESDLLYLSFLPALMTSVGVVEDGAPVTHEEVSDRVRREILGLNASFSTNSRTGRYEIVVRGSGNTAEEAERAVAWMRLVTSSPYWRVENLSRIRDVVGQKLAALRRVMLGPEEAWVSDPVGAWFRQDRPLHLATTAFLTRTHYAHRLRWLLEEPPAGAEAEMLGAFLEAVEAVGATGDRAEVERLLAETRESEGGLVDEAAADLAAALAGVPDDALARDCAYLCERLRRDASADPAETLDALDRVRREVVRAGNARLFVVGSRESQQRLEAPIAALVASAGEGASERVDYSAARVVEARLRERTPDAEPLFVGLVNPNTRGGVIANSARGITYASADRESMLDLLASKLYAGGGAHGVFMKTWGAGLAYSNGLAASPSVGRISYYAERCTELPETLRFVVGELERAQLDASLVEYAVAQVFLEFRSSSSFEARAEAMAADLADGVTPERVRAFREAVLALHDEEGIAEALYARLRDVCGRVLPGLGPASPEVIDGVFFAIGPERQLDLYERYLTTVEGADARLHRLYPRDYWVVAPV